MFYSSVKFDSKLHIMEIRGINEFNSYQQKFSKSRIEDEETILQEYGNNKRSFLLGYCALCEKKSRFFIDPKIIREKRIGQFRANLICEYCNINNRRRFLISFIKNIVENSKINFNVYMYEQITPVYNYVKHQFKKINFGT